MAKPKFWLWTLLVVALVVGFGAGLLAERAILSHSRRGFLTMDYGQHKQMVLKLLSKELRLTPEQSDEIEEIWERNRDRVQSMQKEIRERIMEIRLDVRKEILALLTEEQRERYMKLMERFEKRRKAALDEKGGEEK